MLLIKMLIVLLIQQLSNIFLAFFLVGCDFVVVVLVCLFLVLFVGFFDIIWQTSLIQKNVETSAKFWRRGVILVRSMEFHYHQIHFSAFCWNLLIKRTNPEIKAAVVWILKIISWFRNEWEKITPSKCFLS